MNQTNPHFTQWKNLRQEQKDGFDFEGYKYEYQGSNKGWSSVLNKALNPDYLSNSVYRLVIEDDKFYYSNNKDGSNSTVDLGSALIGWDKSFNNEFSFDRCNKLRPATAEEMPKVEREFKDGYYYPVIYKDGEYDIARYCYERHKFDTIAHNICTKEAFEWIGEELSIDWGKELEGKG